MITRSGLEVAFDQKDKSVTIQINKQSQVFMVISADGLTITIRMREKSKTYDLLHLPDKYVLHYQFVKKVCNALKYVTPIKKRGVTASFSKNYTNNKHNTCNNNNNNTNNI